VVKTTPESSISQLKLGFSRSHEAINCLPELCLLYEGETVDTSRHKKATSVNFLGHDKNPQ